MCLKKQRREKIKLDTPVYEDRALVLFHHDSIGVVPNADQRPNTADKWE